jgi:large repetitive protein
VYIAEPETNIVQEMPAGCNAASCVVTIGGGFTSPWGLAADWQSDVFVADSGTNSAKLIPPGCTAAACVTTYNTGFNYPYDIGIF